jgi:hypothetical protein
MWYGDFGFHCIVTCILTARKRFAKNTLQQKRTSGTIRRLLRGNGTVNIPHQQHRLCLLCGPCRVFIKGQSQKTRPNIPCGGGIEYLQSITASRRRRRIGNSVPGDKTGSPCSLGIWMREPGLPDWGNLESDTVKCGHEYRGTKT